MFNGATDDDKHEQHFYGPKSQHDDVENHTVVTRATKPRKFMTSLTPGADDFKNIILLSIILFNSY